MTLFTKRKCMLCAQLKENFDLSAMQVNVEELEDNNAGALAHLAWHGLVDTARKHLPILVLDDSSAVDEYPDIENHLMARARKYGVSRRGDAERRTCDTGSCSL